MKKPETYCAKIHRLFKHFTIKKNLNLLFMDIGDNQIQTVSIFCACKEEYQYVIAHEDSAAQIIITPGVCSNCGVEYQQQIKVEPKEDDCYCMPMQ